MTPDLKSFNTREYIIRVHTGDENDDFKYALRICLEAARAKGYDLTAPGFELLKHLFDYSGRLVNTLGQTEQEMKRHYGQGS